MTKQPVPATADDRRNALKQELVALEQQDNALQFQAFLGNREQFVARLAEFLPQLADRLVNYLLATPSHQVTPAGVTQRLIDESKDLTEGQVALLKLLLNKLMPAQLPVTSSGRETQPQVRKVSVTVNQIGGDVQEVDGVVGGAARQVTQVRFRRPNPTPDSPIIDGQASEVPPQPQS